MGKKGSNEHSCKSLFSMLRLLAMSNSEIVFLTYLVNPGMETCFNVSLPERVFTVLKKF